MRFRLRFESLESRATPSTLSYDVPLPDPIPSPNHPGDPIPLNPVPAEPAEPTNPDPRPDPVPGPGNPPPA